MNDPTPTTPSPTATAITSAELEAFTREHLAVERALRFGRELFPEEDLTARREAQDDLVALRVLSNLVAPPDEAEVERHARELDRAGRVARAGLGPQLTARARLRLMAHAFWATRVGRPPTADELVAAYQAGLEAGHYREPRRVLAAMLVLRGAPGESAAAVTERARAALRRIGAGERFGDVQRELDPDGRARGLVDLAEHLPLWGTAERFERAWEAGASERPAVIGPLVAAGGADPRATLLEVRGRQDGGPRSYSDVHELVAQALERERRARVWSEVVRASGVRVEAEANPGADTRA